VPAQHHAISESARRVGFWPSVALASTLVQQRVTPDVGRARLTNPAVRGLGSPDAVHRDRRMFGGSR
jgi:hypothetical protein